MDLERVTVALRPRGSFEAIDLGFRMAATWWRSVWGTWLVLFVPFAAALHLALPDQPFWAAFAAWWMKPLFDRFVLYVISRRVFGNAVGVGGALAAWREVLSPGLLADLTWRRPVSPLRSFVLPVTLLERSTGAVARRRRQVLGNRTSGHAFALSLVCLGFEFVVWIGLAFLVGVLLAPEQGATDHGASAYEAWVWWTHVDSLWYLSAVSVIEPFYVAAGFALYLNRRVGLEAWDVELALRRLERRLAQAAATARPAAAILLALACVWAAPFATGSALAEEAAARPRNVAPAKTVPAADAAPQPTEAKRLAGELYADPDFGGTREVRRWRLRERDAPERPLPRSAWLESAVEAVARLLQFLGWLGIGAAVLAILIAIARWTMRGERIGAPAAAPPAELFGLSIDPDSLPDDIQAAALAACRAGDARGALSLIYRGALSALVHGRGITISAGAVEADVLRAARTVLPAGAAAWFAGVLDAWIAVAWARQPPDVPRITALAADYDRHFRRTGQPAAAAEAPA